MDSGLTHLPCTNLWTPYSDSQANARPSMKFSTICSYVVNRNSIPLFLPGFATVATPHGCTDSLHEDFTAAVHASNHIYNGNDASCPGSGIGCNWPQFNSYGFSARISSTANHCQMLAGKSNSSILDMLPVQLTQHHSLTMGAQKGEWVGTSDLLITIQSAMNH